MKKQFYILPPTKPPVIGSGKISRRIVKYIPKRRRVSFSEVNTDRFGQFMSGKKPTPKKKLKPIPFKTAAVKLLFNRWNQMGPPFVQHSNSLNRTTATAVERLYRAISDDGRNKVIMAMERTYELFNADWFRFRILMAKRKISLPAFFRYDDYNYKTFRNESVPRSWYKECRDNSLGELELKYSIMIKDNFPETTNALVASWCKYQDLHDVHPKLKNQLVITAKKIRKTSVANEIPWNILTMCIDKMLNEWRTFKPKHAGYLINETFWNETLPKELRRSNILDDRQRKDWIVIND